MEFIKSTLSRTKTSQSGAGNLDASSNCELLSAYGRLERTPDGYHAHFVPNPNGSANKSGHWFQSLFVTEDQQRLKTDGLTNGQQYTKWGPPAPGETKRTVQAIALGKEFTKKPTKERSAPGFILAKQSGGWRHDSFCGGLVCDTSTPIWGSIDDDQRNQATEFAILNSKRSVHVTGNSSAISKAYRKGYSESPTTSNSAVQFLTPSAGVPGLEQLYFRDGELTAVVDTEKANRIRREMTEHQGSATANAYPESYHGQGKQGYYGYPGTASGSGQGTQYQSR